MRQHIFSLTMAVSLVAVSPAITACGDKWTGDAVPADAGPADAPSVDSAPVDAELPSCAAGWSDLQMGTDLDDQVWGMTLDRDHNIYISGFEEGVTGVTNIEPAGNSRGVVLRLDPKGGVQWKAVLDTAATDVMEHVAVDSSSGKSFAIGRTSGAFDGFSNQGQFDAFLVELDAKGQTTALFQWGDERPQHPVRLSLGPKNAIAVAGFDDTYIPSNYVEAWEDGFIAGLDMRRASESNFTQRFLQKVPNRRANRITDGRAHRARAAAVGYTSPCRTRRAARTSS